MIPLRLRSGEDTSKLFQEAKEAASQGKDMELGPVYRCPVCGHTVVDHLPDKCPVCGAKGEMYKHLYSLIIF